MPRNDTWQRRRARVACAALAIGLMQAGSADSHHAEQARLLLDIAADFGITRYLTGVEGMSPAVETAMHDVPRHAFVRREQRDYAYINRPLSIGHGQTISQPFIVALMTELAGVGPDDRVLEIGTGSGYQAAVLAEIVAQVYTIEIVAPLAVSARERLARLGYANVHVQVGDGNHGWPDAAPFDAIVVTAAGRIPPALVDQLKPGGRMVIPVDVAVGEQELVLVRKARDGTVTQTSVLPVRFVPLTGDN